MRLSDGIRRTLVPLLVGAAFGLGAASPAAACNIPVFRYALERWPSDPYEVLIYHRGTLGASEKSMIDTLAKQADGNSAANIEVRVVNLDTEYRLDVLELFPVEAEAQLPWMILRYPVMTRIPENAWEGRLTPEIVQALLDSPARREIARRILKGDTAVWVLVKCGIPAKDAAAERRLQDGLKDLPKLLKLPMLTNDPEDRLMAEAGPPLKIAFSTLTISPNDPAERIFASTLLATEPDLPWRMGLMKYPTLDAHWLSPSIYAYIQSHIEPMAFAVFGRGRALEALIGAGINKELLEEVGAYLVGPCSCQVKRQHPGIDLLMSTNWDEHLKGLPVKEPEPITLIGLTPAPPPTSANGPKSEPPPVPIDSKTPEPAAEPLAVAPQPTDSPLYRNIALALLGGLIVVAAAAILLKGPLGMTNGKR